MRDLNLLLVILISVLNASPASASDWLVYRSGQTRSTELWKGAKPVPGVNVPASSKVVVFKPLNGDTDVHHYSLGQVTENGQQVDAAVFDPPAPPMAPAPDPNRPNLDGFISAIWADANLQPLRLQLVSFKPLLRDYLNQANGAQVIQEAWADLKAGMPAPAAALVESYAANYHIPLVAAE